MQISWQAQHFVNLQAQISWQAQHFVNLHAQISWQAQHFVNLQVQISWQAQYKMRFGEIADARNAAFFNRTGGFKPGKSSSAERRVRDGLGSFSDHARAWSESSLHWALLLTRTSCVHAQQIQTATGLCSTSFHPARTSSQEKNVFRLGEPLQKFAQRARRPDNVRTERKVSLRQLRVVVAELGGHRFSELISLAQDMASSFDVLLFKEDDREDSLSRRAVDLNSL